MDLEVARAEIVGFLGPNGAGKTTTLRMLATLLPVDEGRATVAGFDVGSEPERVRTKIGYVGQLGGADELASGRENLVLQARLYGLERTRAARRALQLIELFDLGEFADRRASTYSGGQRRRLDVALGLTHQPEVLFLDEPSTGLDPQNRANLWEHIEAERARGTTIFLTTHYLEEADALCDRVMIIDRGEIVAGGTPAELKQEVSGDQVTVTLSEPADALRAGAALRGQAFVREFASDGGELRMYVNDGGDALPQILRLLDGQHIALTSISVSKPTLNDVFLRKTGRSLHEPGHAPGVKAAA